MGPVVANIQLAQFAPARILSSLSTVCCSQAATLPAGGLPGGASAFHKDAGCMSPKQSGARFSVKDVDLEDSEDEHVLGDVTQSQVSSISATWALLPKVPMDRSNCVRNTKHMSIITL